MVSYLLLPTTPSHKHPIEQLRRQIIGRSWTLPQIFLEAEQISVRILHQKLPLALGDTGLRGIPVLCQRVKQRDPVLLTHGHHGTHIGYFDLQVDATPKWLLKRCSVPAIGVPCFEHQLRLTTCEIDKIWLTPLKSHRKPQQPIKRQRDSYIAYR